MYMYTMSNACQYKYQVCVHVQHYFQELISTPVNTCIP